MKRWPCHNDASSAVAGAGASSPTMPSDARPGRMGPGWDRFLGVSAVMALLLMLGWAVTEIDLFVAVALLLAAASALIALASAGWHRSSDDEKRLRREDGREFARARGRSAYDGLVDEELR